LANVITLSFFRLKKKEFIYLRTFLFRGFSQQFLIIQFTLLQEVKDIFLLQNKSQIKYIRLSLFSHKKIVLMMT